VTDRELNALFGLLALREGFLSREQLLAALELLPSGGEPDLGRFLLTQRVIRESQMRAVEALVAAMLETHGSAARALEAIEGPRGVREKLLPPGEDAPSSIRKSRSTFRRRKPKPPPAAPAERFILGPELGRGGLAQVLEATDREIGRTVALKVVPSGEGEEVLERFRWEARITGRLEHPNIVPVHEMGELPASNTLYFAMKKIVGQDLHDVIHSRKVPLRRLVEILRDVCRAVAFAHSRGVIHRDLKPANVMVGDFGEVLVVDWGLARLIGDAEAPGDRRVHRKDHADVAKRAESSHLTLEGDVLGTPSYMPPEQALGHLAELDARSDVYSLGAILYEILTNRPPHTADTSWGILDRVVTEPVRPPRELHDVPPDLDAICLRALSKKKEDRFPGAAELAAEIDAWLEGTKERERREGLAGEQAKRGAEAIARWKKLSGEAVAVAAHALELEEAYRPKHGEERKRALWEAEDRADELERASTEALAEAEAALASAMSNVPGHAEARRLRAELAWERFLQAEKAEDRPGMQLMLAVAKEHNDGSLDARLRGDGSIAVETREWTCRCLEEGREVSPAELAVHGYHPWSGRRLATSVPEGLRALEPAGPLRLRVHAASCARAPLEGAQVWVFRFREIDRRLIPVTERPSMTPVPDRVLDALYADSPYRPQGGGTYLGSTPVAPRPWPMGSWLLIMTAEGREPMRVPFEVGRNEDAAVAATLLRNGEIPAGLLPISAGRWHWQGDRQGTSRNAEEIRKMDDFLLASQPVTCREYAAFLDALGPEDGAPHVPRQSEKSGFCWPWIEGQGFAIPTAAWLASATEADRKRASRLADSPVDWEEDWPVFGISWEDAVAYTHWLSLRDGRVFLLPHEEQWERAARGADDRFFPWGKRFDFANLNLNESQDVPKPCSVHSFPGDESPFGIRGMGGNARDCCLNDPGGEQTRWRIARGGSWPNARTTARSTYRAGSMARNVTYGTGFRVACAVRVPCEG